MRVIIGSYNGLSPVLHQAIPWTNADLLPMWPLGINVRAISIEIHKFSFKNALENKYLQVQSWKKIFVCKVVDILFQLLWVKSGRLAISSCDQHHYLPWLSALSDWDGVLVPLGDTLHSARNKQVWWCDEMEIFCALLMISKGNLLVTVENTETTCFPDLPLDLLASMWHFNVKIRCCKY